jgi:hypothetical protein
MCSTGPRGVHCILCLRTTCVHDPSPSIREVICLDTLYTYVFPFKYMYNVSIREYPILNVFIVCIHNTARSKSIPLMCTHVDSCKFSTVYPPIEHWTWQPIGRTWIYRIQSHLSFIQHKGLKSI